MFREETKKTFGRMGWFSTFELSFCIYRYCEIDRNRHKTRDDKSIRVGINSGEVEIRENDIYGLNVNFTSRIQHALPGAGILTANSVQRDYNKRFGELSGVKFIPREGDLRSFGKETVFFVATPDLSKVRQQRWKARNVLLGN